MSRARLTSALCTTAVLAAGLGAVAGPATAGGPPTRPAVELPPSAGAPAAASTAIPGESRRRDRGRKVH